MAEVMPEITIPDLATLDVERPTISVAKRVMPPFSVWQMKIGRQQS